MKKYTPHCTQSMVLAPLCAFLALSLTIGGCRSVQSASLNRSGSTFAPETPVRNSAPTPSAEVLSDVSAGSAAITPSRWPTRWGDDRTSPGTIVELDPAEPLRPIHLSRFHQFRSTQVEYDDAAELAAAVGIESGFKFMAEGPGSFLFIPNPTNKPSPDITQDNGTLTKSDTPDLAFKFVSATLGVEPEGDGSQPKEDFVKIQRTWFTYKDAKQRKPTPTPDHEPVGTILLLPGMFGTPDPIVDALERYWHNKNYAVLRMRSQPSRFTEHDLIEVHPGQESTIAIRAARVNDDRVAEAAYATKAAIDHIIALRPNLADKPVILVGMSGGAMLLPTIYAYAPEHYDGAVLIAGGVDFIRIAIQSNYKSWIDAIVFDFKPSDPSNTGSPTPDQLETLSRHYLSTSQLDAYHTATEMSTIPVLMLHASADKAVPASTGRLLYQQLGEPERWSYPLGHELIFAGLPTQVSRIDRWITKHVLMGSGSTPDATSPGVGSSASTITD